MNVPHECIKESVLASLKGFRMPLNNGVGSVFVESSLRFLVHQAESFAGEVHATF
jgi:hypothetical protein